MQNPAATHTRQVPPLEVRHRRVDESTCVVSIEGDVDLASAPRLKSALAELVAAGYDRFVLDLVRLDHMDSTGLGVLVGFQKRLDGGVVVIARPPQNVVTVLEVTGLAARFDVFATIDEAIARTTAAGADPLALSTDAALVIGLASTALPFADTPAAQAERWLRLLRVHGDAAIALGGLGPRVGSLPPAQAAPDHGEEAPRGDRERIESIVRHAEQIAAQRSATAVSTADVLAGVMVEYGPDFDRVLSAYGSDREAVTERL
jgi:anti-sigma B factor antagonist